MALNQEVVAGIIMQMYYYTYSNAYIVVFIYTQINCYTVPLMFITLIMMASHSFASKIVVKKQTSSAMFFPSI